jgi:predicted phage terminase large subunit-like protein
MTQIVEGLELLTAEEVKNLMHLAEHGDDATRSKVFEMLRRDRSDRCKVDFLCFVEQMWPVFISGKHHAIMADAFERVARGELKRLIINMPPRHTKSEFASFLLPSWFLGKFPHKKIIQTAHTAELAVGFGRKVRNLVSSENYQQVFTTKLSSDSKAAGRWNTNVGGDYFAIGVGGAVTGKGADLLIIDDPHSEQEAKQNNAAVFDNVYEWFTSGPRQRLQPGGAIIIVMTRWSKRDLTGQIIKNSAKDGVDQWETIEFPAIMPSGTPLWPAFWSKEALEALKSELPVAKWEAQYQQNPTSEEGAIIKRDQWQLWEGKTPPQCEYIIQSWDTAFEKTNRADYSACTTWGVFQNPDKHGNLRANIILLDAYKERLEFPELKAKAFEMWKEWEPDTLIVEKRAAGAPLIYEMRKMGIPMSEFTPGKGNDKISRVNAISDLFASGMVWCPETRWAEEVMDELASFPNGDHDDLVDSSSQALMRFRQGGFITIDTDEPDEPIYHRRKAEYY